MRLKLIVVFGLMGTLAGYSEGKRVLRALDPIDTTEAVVNLAVGILCVAVPAFAPFAPLVLAISALVFELIRPADDTPQKLNNIYQKVNELHNEHSEMLRIVTQQIQSAVSELKIVVYQPIIQEILEEVTMMNATFIKYLNCFADPEMTKCTEVKKNKIASDLGGLKFLQKLTNIESRFTQSQDISVPDVFTIIQQQYQYKVQENIDCNTQETAQELQLYLYILAVETLLKGYTMKLGALFYELGDTIKDPKVESQWINQRNNYIKKCSDAIEAMTTFAVAMKQGSRELRSCDTTAWEFGKTYTHLEGFKQLMIFSPRADTTSVFGIKCNGEKQNCDNQFSRRVAYYHRPGRRLWSITDRSDNCEYGRPGRNDSMERFDIQFGVAAAFWTMCLCVAKPSAGDGILNHFYAYPSPVPFPRVIVSANFHPVKGGVCLRICSAELNITSYQIQKETLQCLLPKKVYDENFSWYYVADLNGIHMTDVEAPENAWITGFAVYVENGYLLPKIYYENIEAFLDGHSYKHEKQAPYKASAQRIKLHQPDWPLAANRKGFVRSKPGGHYVQFEPTHVARDLSQSVVPYFDMQSPIANDKYRPLGGVGFYYKNPDRCDNELRNCVDYDYGGFIGIKFMNVEMTSLYTRSVLSFSNMILESLKTNNFSGNPFYDDKFKDL